MRNFYVIFLLHILTLIAQAQKPIVDTNTINTWTYPPYDLSITKDGRYVCYSLFESQKERIIYIKTTDGAQQYRFSNATNPLLVGNDNYIVFMQGKDSLGIFELETRKLRYVVNASVPQFPKNNTHWLAWKKAVNNKDLVVWNSITDEQKIYREVSNWKFSDDGKVLLLKIKVNHIQFSVKWIDLTSNEEAEIWRGNEEPNNFTFNGNLQQVAFFIADTAWTEKKSKICVVGPRIIAQYINIQTIGMENDYHPCKESMMFSNDGQRLYFKVVAQVTPKSIPLINAASVDIWHYKDLVIQEQQLFQSKEPTKSIQAIAHLLENRVVLLKLKENERIKSIDPDAFYQLIIREEQLPNEKQFISFQAGFGRDSYILWAVKDGARIVVLNKEQIENTSISPTGTFFMWYDIPTRQYQIYNTRTRNRRTITTDFKVPLYYKTNYKDIRSGPGGNIVGWLAGDTSVLLYDQYDIWQLNPISIHKSVNLTKGFGRRHNIQFRLLALNEGKEILNYAFGDTVLLKAIDMGNMDEGIYYIIIGNNRKPTKLMNGPYQYQVMRKTGRNYIFQRQNTTEAPNWFMTSDFRNFNQLTDIQPQKPWNWYNSEMIRWPLPDGLIGKGILHKPENFEASKKYPLIFLVYEERITGLNSFRAPALSRAEIDIPWFVSRGYLVFEPDIYFKVGFPGQSAFNTVTSAARFLARKPWVDVRYMGLSGASHGGYEINYIVTRSDLFAAAAPAFGDANLISNYGELRGWPYGSSGSQQYVLETFQLRIGSTLWERPDLYIKNSPIFSANNIVTPLLILQNKEDGNVPWGQGLEWFMALRRLGKKAWLLQYDGEGHGLSKKVNQLDFTIRIQQFFDHYLKCNPAPIWMTRGIPAKLKLMQAGFELDSPNKIP